MSSRLLETSHLEEKKENSIPDTALYRNFLKQKKEAKENSQRSRMQKKSFRAISC